MKLWWIHGYSRNSADFDAIRAQIPCLLESQAIQLPGHQDSRLPFAAQELSALLEYLNSQIQPDDLVVGHSLGARIALALRSECKKIAISPPQLSGFSKEARKELLGVLDPRQVRGEAKPMATLVEWLTALNCFPIASNAEILVGENDLNACAVFCADQAHQVVRGADHLSILTAHTTLLTVLKETYGLFESN